MKLRSKAKLEELDNIWQEKSHLQCEVPCSHTKLVRLQAGNKRTWPPSRRPGIRSWQARIGLAYQSDAHLFPLQVPISRMSVFDLAAPGGGDGAPVGLDDEGVELHYLTAVGAGQLGVQRLLRHLGPDAAVGAAEGLAFFV